MDNATCIIIFYQELIAYRYTHLVVLVLVVVLVVLLLGTTSSKMPKVLSFRDHHHAYLLEEPSGYTTSHLGRLSLLPSVG